MNPHFKIIDIQQIYSILDKVEYGTLALSVDDIPYAVPLNFVRVDDTIYFHGALSNKKMKILSKNPKVSFSVVQNYSLIASFFSSRDGLACPATQFFKSVSIDGEVEMVEGREEKATMLEALMKKLQPEGRYKPFSDAEYDTAIKATAVVKIVPSKIQCKFKFGQHVSKERFDMILVHLAERNKEIDQETYKMMKQLRVDNAI